MSKRRVVVTGLGIISPVGSTVKSAWDAIVRGESGIGPITKFDVSAFPVRFGGSVREFDVTQYITPKDARRMDEFMHYGVAAGIQAVTDSGIDFSKLDAERCGAVCASNSFESWTRSRATVHQPRVHARPAAMRVMLRRYSRSAPKGS